MSNEIKKEETKKADGPRRFLTKKKTEPVVIDDQDYMIVQMTGKAKEEWQNSMNARWDYDKDGVVIGTKDVKGVLWDLLSRCLFKVNPQDPKNPLLPLKREEVEDVWPSEVQEELYKLARTLNGLDVKGVDEAKNA